MSAAHQQHRSETDTERHARVAREAELIAEADAGLLIPAAEVNAWIDSLGTAKELPLRSLPSQPDRPTLQRSVSYTPMALRDLAAAFRWLSQPGSGARAQRRIQRIRRVVDGLADHRCRYPIGPNIGRREFTCERHRIVDRVRQTPAGTRAPAT